MTKIINAEELFPDWKQARPILKKFIEGVDGFKAKVVSNDLIHSYSVNINLRIPRTLEEKTGKIISVINTFPIEHQSTVKNMCYTVLKDRIPQGFIEKWRYYAVFTSDDYLCSLIEHELDKHELYMVANGYRSLKEELAYSRNISRVL